MNFLKINFETKESIISSFESIAKKLFSHYILKINDAHYRLTNIEFYCFTKSIIFQDPYTHRNNLQLSQGKLYLHGSGIDLTCGDGENYCSILIRGIAKLHDGATHKDGFIKYQVEGPHKVATELFSNIKSLSENSDNEIKLIDIEGHNQDSLFVFPKLILKTNRVGLYDKGGAFEGYFKSLPIRYLAFTPLFRMRFRGIEEILRENLKRGELTEQEAIEILGYKKVFNYS